MTCDANGGFLCPAMALGTGQTSRICMIRAADSPTDITFPNMPAYCGDKGFGTGTLFSDAAFPTGTLTAQGATPAAGIAFTTALTSAVECIYGKYNQPKRKEYLLVHALFDSKCFFRSCCDRSNPGAFRNRWH